MARLKRVRRDGRAISPVIATVIIVAIAIAIAIAVAFWAVGLTGIFTRYEEVKVTSAYAESDGAGGFIVHIRLKNTGSADATLDDCFINGKPYDAFVASTTVLTTPGGDIIGGATSGTYTLVSGATVDIDIAIPMDPGANSGQTLDIKLHTAAGRDYPRAVVLP